MIKSTPVDIVVVVVVVVVVMRQDLLRNCDARSGESAPSKDTCVRVPF